MLSFTSLASPKKPSSVCAFPPSKQLIKIILTVWQRKLYQEKKCTFHLLVSNNPKNLAKNRNFSVCPAFWSRVTGTAHLFQMRYTMAAIDGGTTVEVDSSNEMHGDLIRDDSWSQWVFGHLHLLDLFKEEQTTDCLSVLFYKAIHFEGRTKAKENIGHIFFGLHNSARDLLMTVDLERQVKVPPHIITQSDFIADIVLASDLVGVSHGFSREYKGASWGGGAMMHFA